MNPREPWDRLHLVAMVLVIAVCLGAFIAAETFDPTWKRTAGVAAMSALVAYAVFNLVAGWRTGVARVRAFRAHRVTTPRAWLFVMGFWTVMGMVAAAVLALNVAR